MDKTVPLVPYECESDEDFSVYSDTSYSPSTNESEFSDYEVSSAHNLTRRRRSNKRTWKVNIVKSRRFKCLPYKNKYKECLAKFPKEVNCSNCAFKCNSNFSDKDRLDICKTYWGLGDYSRQKDFILKYVTKKEPKRRKVAIDNEHARSISKSYYLENYEGRKRVCAKFFEKTLCISNGPINTALRGCNLNGCYDYGDGRGRKTPGNKTSESDIAFVKKHIESFPVMESHYSRITTKKLYLDSSLSISKMHELYKNDFCKENEISSPVTEKTYRRIFCENYNYSFFKPKKDLCALCYKYEKATTIQTKKDLETEYCLHLVRKWECNEAKRIDKLRCKEDPSFLTCTFDLQSVLHIPNSDVSLFYYSRKICVYNLTIYVGDGEEAHCFTWIELHGKRGSNEIGSILYKFLLSLPATVSEISLFCDTCGGQNRNQHVAAILLHVLQVSTNLVKIELKFLESGHTYMECDSMHSAIEAAKRHKSVFCMNDWAEIFKSARRKRANKYQVHMLTYKDFYNLHELAVATIKNRSKDKDGLKVSWLKIKCIKVEKSEPDTLFYSYDHTSDYREINICAGKGRPRTRSPKINHAYEAMLPISAAKKADLLKLCNAGQIPEEMVPWYRNLPSTTFTGRESLPEPLFEESDNESNNN